MRTITGLFDNQKDARDAISALEGIGVSSHNISLVANSAVEGGSETHDAAEVAGTGAGVGAVVGGVGGLLAGLGALAIPGVGPVVAAGWLVTTVVGAATGAVVGGAAGGLVGALTDSGVPETDAHVYAEGVRRGGTLVTARVEESHEGLAEDILTKASRVDVSERRAAFEDEGWAQFDPAASPYSAEEIRDYRARVLPPII